MSCCCYSGLPKLNYQEPDSKQLEPESVLQMVQKLELASQPQSLAIDWLSQFEEAHQEPNLKEVSPNHDFFLVLGLIRCAEDSRSACLSSFCVALQKPR